jgi:hypothetical protein
VTAPADPARGVSSEEFEEMVRDLGVEPEPEAEPDAPQPATAGSRPAGGRRARSRAAKDSDGGDKPKKPPNRRHGRPR